MKKSLLWFCFGICFGIVLSITGAYMLGPRGYRTAMNAYDGATWTDYDWLWHHRRIQSRVSEHTRWARSHMTTNRTYWPVFVCSEQREWFGRTYCGDGVARDIVRSIYELPVSEERKIALLREYHQDIADMLVVDEHRYVTLCNKWDAKLAQKP